MFTLPLIVSVFFLCLAGIFAVNQSGYSQADQNKLMGAMMALAFVILLFVLANPA